MVVVRIYGREKAILSSGKLGGRQTPTLFSSNTTGLTMNDIRLLEQGFLRDDIPDFRPGDTVRLHVRVMEAGRERIQVFEGVVIGRSGGGLQETFTVRKISFGVGVERIFPVHAPIVSRIEVLRKGLVRRAKLHYLRGRSGKSARIKERRD